MKKLRKCPVFFDAVQHTYTLDGKELSGITSIIQNKIFPDMYKDVPTEMLNKAAKRGTSIHQQIELYNEGFAPEEKSEELKSYIKFFTASSYNVLATEYLVSDLKHIASPIDIVYTDGENNIILADVKTTSVLHLQYVQWQLSIYAHLFEFQNKGLKVAKLIALHIRNGECKEVELSRIEDKYIIKLINSFVKQKDFKNPIEAKLKAKLKPLENNLAKISKQLKELKEKEEELKQIAIEVMKSSYASNYKGSKVTFIYKGSSTRNVIDNELLKEKYQDVYQAVLKKSLSKESLTIKTI